MLGCGTEEEFVESIVMPYGSLSLLQETVSFYLASSPSMAQNTWEKLSVGSGPWFHVLSYQ